jgi:hypothetical protein
MNRRKCKIAKQKWVKKEYFATVYKTKNIEITILREKK